MNESGDELVAPHRRAVEIRLRGVMTDSIVAELGAEQGDTSTIVVVRPADRAQLHGFIRRVEDLGLEMISMNEIRGQ